MNVVVVVGAALATALAVITYILFQRTSLSFSVDVFINSEPKEVFNFLKEPKNLPDIDHRTKSTEVHRFIINPDGTEHREYVSQEVFRHVGIQPVSTWASSNPDQLVIHHSTVTLYSLIRSHSVFNFKPFQYHGRYGTLVTERMDIHIPYALHSFVNRTVQSAHKDMLHHLKFIMERTYDTDKDFSEEYHHKPVETQTIERIDDHFDDSTFRNEDGFDDDEDDLFHNHKRR